MAIQPSTVPYEVGDDPVDFGQHLGRYRIDGVIGSGGMGIVLAAHDPQLDRAVALKLLRHPDASSTSLLAEGQALARLRHTHVVTVHDVGEVGGRVFIAMELVRGQTMRSWCDAAPRPWRDVVARYLDAARGLAAAHDKGIVHRDFKPDNVLLGDDGVVRVVDFGLAVSPGQAHAHAGTPAYMAPEQRDGEIGHAADQYAFAVALWEALTGKRPGAAEPTPRRTGPAWLFGVLRKALSAAPSARYPTMHGLIAAIERGLARRRHALLVSAAALALAGTAAVAVMATHGGSPSCAASRDAVTRVWNPAARAGLIEKLATSSRLNARATSERLVAALDRRATQLADAREDGCSAHPTEGDRIMACLDRQVVALGATIAQLGRADDAAIDHGVAAVESLPEPLLCSATATAARGVLDPAKQAVIDPLEARRAAADALGAAGHLPEARAALDWLAPAVRASGYAPLEADFELTRAHVLGALNDSVAARAAYELAAAAGARFGDDHVIARAWLGVVDETADGGAPQDAARDLHFAEVAVERAGMPELREELLWIRSNVELGAGDLAGARRDIEAALASIRARGAEHTLRGARLTQELGRVLYKSDDPEHAARHDRRALEIFVDLLGPEHIDVARVLGNLAIDLDERGATAEARSLLERALAIKERTVGPDDLPTAATLQGLEVVASRAGQYADAIRYGERIREIRERKLGPAHPLLASELGNLASNYLVAGRLDDAEAAARRALAIREKANGPNHDSVAFPLQFLAGALVRRGRPDEALALLERARGILEHTIGPTKLRTGVIWSAIGDVEQARGHRDRACAAWNTAVAIIQHEAGPDDRRAIAALVGVAGCKLDDHDAVAARAIAEHVLAICQRGGLPAFSSGPAHLVHARALSVEPEHRARAIAELEAALRSYDGAPPSLDAERADLRSWLERMSH